MSFLIQVSPLVSRDIRDASDWYTSRSLNLGKIFEEHAFQALSNLIQKPLLTPTKYNNIRTKRISKKFPYFIHYEVNIKENLILVYAIIHGKQNPRKWDNERAF